MLFNEATELEAFWKAIQANPKDTLPMLVFADKLDEMPSTGANRSLAFALRWAASRKRYPLVSPAGRVATWFAEPPYKGRAHYGPYRPCVLPRIVFDQLLPRHLNDRFKTDSVSAAFRRLSMALRSIRAVIGWEI